MRHLDHTLAPKAWVTAEKVRFEKQSSGRSAMKQRLLNTAGTLYSWPHRSSGCLPGLPALIIPAWLNDGLSTAEEPLAVDRCWWRKSHVLQGWVIWPVDHVLVDGFTPMHIWVVLILYSVSYRQGRGHEIRMGTWWGIQEELYRIMIKMHHIHLWKYQRIILKEHYSEKNERQPMEWKRIF